jgi:hypothetical protein
MSKSRSRKTVKILASRSLTLGFVFLSLFMGSCSSGSGARNDQPPSGTVVGSGSFTSTGSAITGTVTIYDQGGGNYVVRLANLSIAQPEASFQLQADITSSASRVTVSGNLAAYSGNVNYSYNAGQETGWSVVYIHQPANQTDPGIATIQQQ